MDSGATVHVLTRKVRLLFLIHGWHLPLDWVTTTTSTGRIYISTLVILIGKHRFETSASAPSPDQRRL